MEEVLQPTESASLRGRMQVWRETVGIWARYPVLGTGPNSFHTAYPMYRESSVTGHRTHPENLYVETLADSGMVGIAIAIWATVAALAAMRRDRHGGTRDPILTFAVTAAIVVAGVHAAVDFAPYVPLYSLTLGALVGLALPAQHERLLPAATVAAAALALAVCFVAPVIVLRDSIYHVYRSSMHDLARSLVWSPTSQHAWFYAGRELIRREDGPAKILGERFMTQSMMYDPKNYRHWIKLGEIRLKLNDRDGAREAYERAHALRRWVRVPAHLKEAP
jgi:hypothetical protein